jgi:hypothetical protein
MAALNMAGIRAGTNTHRYVKAQNDKADIVTRVAEKFGGRAGNILFASNDEGDWIATAFFDDAEDRRYVGVGNSVSEALDKLILDMP